MALLHFDHSRLSGRYTTHYPRCLKCFRRNLISQEYRITYTTVAIETNGSPAAFMRAVPGAGSMEGTQSNATARTAPACCSLSPSTASGYILSLSNQLSFCMSLSYLCLSNYFIIQVHIFGR